MSFEDLTRTRFSCRHYEDRPVEDAVLARVIEAGRIAPSACNNHPTRIKVCTSKDDLARAALACPRFERNGSIFGAPAVIIACAETERAWVRKYDQMNSSEIDTSIVVDQMMMAATEQGLGTCWVCAFDPQVIKEQFGLPAGLRPISMLPLGYPAETIAAPEAREARCISLADFTL